MSDKTELESSFSGTRVFITGHTGFKGSWLTMWLASVGARVTGYALAPNTTPALFDIVSVREDCTHTVGDIRDRDAVMKAVRKANPDFLFHLAAQPLVRRSYECPLETIDTNIIGTANVLEAVRVAGNPVVVIVVTSDKCYENREWYYRYRENDRMGGSDVYSMSKGATELLVSSYRRSFFSPARLKEHGVRLASVRAGNVLGGGDWAADRIVPDLARSVASNQPLKVRNPDSVRPWQHVLDPLSGYLLLAGRMAKATDELETYCDAWNFGPDYSGVKTVRDVVSSLIEKIGSGSWTPENDGHLNHEAKLLLLSIDKATAKLGWKPRWNFHQTMTKTADWYRAYLMRSKRSLRQLSLRQIGEHMQPPAK